MWDVVAACISGPRDARLEASTAKRVEEDMKKIAVLVALEIVRRLLKKL